MAVLFSGARCASQELDQDEHQQQHHHDQEEVEHEVQPSVVDQIHGGMLHLRPDSTRGRCGEAML